jgi:transposase-like protein
MTAGPTRPDDTRPRCPLCGEDVLIDRDSRTRRYFCFVCAHSWKEN